MSRAPALFVSHGAPTFALEPGLLGPRLTALGRQLANVAAVLVVSPHWQTTGPIRVMHAARPDTLHDFRGFPEPLYELQYPAPGAPAVARATVERLRASGLEAQVDDARPLDHGAWVPLRYLLPEASVPVFQVSLPRNLTPAGALELGQALAPLRERGVVILGSGSMTHNLAEFRGPVSDPEYARDFAAWVQRAVTRGDIGALIDYRARAPHAARAHPTEEHYLPLLVALGAATPTEPVTPIDGGITHGILSMDCYAWGMNPA